MSVVEDFFERFEKGEIRTVEAEYTAAEDVEGDNFSSDSNGEVVVTISDLVSVEDDVAVLLNTASSDDPDYQPIKQNTDPVGAQSTLSAEDLTNTDELEDNQLGLIFYNASGTDATSTSTDTGLPDFKVIARGY